MCKCFVMLLLLFILSQNAAAITVDSEVQITPEQKMRAVDIYYIGYVNNKGVTNLISILNMLQRQDSVDNINIILCSNGGDIIYAIAAYNYIQNLPKTIKITTHNISSVAWPSMILYCSANNRSSSFIAQFQILQTELTINNRNYTKYNFEEQSSYVKNMNDNAVHILSACSDKKIHEISDLYLRGVTLNPQQAKELGFVHTIINFVPGKYHESYIINSE